MSREPMVAALYVETNGVYYGLDGVDPWDEARDARLYAGPWPVVAHPPCQRWCRLAGMLEVRFGLKRGDDEGCFEAALNAVRRYGGVLEHPAHSEAWAAFDLPVPVQGGGWVGSLLDEGVSAWVEQGHYGHALRKPTWLYACGIDAAPLRWGRGPGRTLPHRDPSMGSRDRRRLTIPTPLAFRDVLLDLARSVSRERVAA